ncbi:MAG: metallophosphoesterase [Candidatus Aenigmatarchaeota archaeon]
MNCIFTSDLHGDRKKYNALFKVIKEKGPDGVFLGGDLFPPALGGKHDIESFLKVFLREKLEDVNETLGGNVEFFVIMGNDDPKKYQTILETMSESDLMNYIHMRTVKFGDLHVAGYSYIPPSPFRLKDWERYDVSRHVDVGAVSPEEGMRTAEMNEYDKKYQTIKKDLKEMVNISPPEKTIYLFHSPPYNTNLDRADLDDEMIDHAPLDVHVGSIAIKRFIEEKKPFITLHGHVHETVEMTGEWSERFHSTFSFTGVHKGPELCFIQFDTEEPENAERKLVSSG